MCQRLRQRCIITEPHVGEGGLDVRGVWYLGTTFRSGGPAVVATQGDQEMGDSSMILLYFLTYCGNTKAKAEKKKPEPAKRNR